MPRSFARFENFFSPPSNQRLLCVIIRFSTFVCLRFYFHLFSLTASLLPTGRNRTCKWCAIMCVFSLRSQSLSCFFYRFYFYLYVKICINWIYASASLSAGNELPTRTPNRYMCTVYVTRNSNTQSKHGFTNRTGRILLFAFSHLQMIIFRFSQAIVCNYIKSLFDCSSRPIWEQWKSDCHLLLHVFIRIFLQFRFFFYYVFAGERKPTSTITLNFS